MGKLIKKGERKSSLLTNIYNFPITDYLKHHYPDGKLNSTGQYMATCPKCNKFKMYYSPKLLKGLCFHCSDNTESGEGMFSDLLSFIMFTENIEYEKAVAIVKDYTYDTSIDSSLVEIDKAIKGLSVTEDDLDPDDFINIPIQVDIPKKLAPDLKLVKKYLSGNKSYSRKNPMTLRILEIFPAWFSNADFLADRLVFEIHTNNSRAWLGYYIGKDKEIRKNRKTLNPFGNILSNMLHGYNYFKNSDKPLLLHEGIFDVHRSVLRGYNAVCSFGKNLSPRQIMLINETKAKELVLCYDADSSGMKGMWGIVKKWRNNIAKDVSMMLLPYKEDPDSATAEQEEEAFQTRREIA